jgi:hypothetical protein
MLRQNAQNFTSVSLAYFPVFMFQKYRDIYTALICGDNDAGSYLLMGKGKGRRKRIECTTK